MKKVILAQQFWVEVSKVFLVCSMSVPGYQLFSEFNFITRNGCSINLIGFILSKATINI